MIGFSRQGLAIGLTEVHRYFMGKPLEEVDRAYGFILCPKCRLEMRLFAIEPEKPGRDLFTFECSGCSHVEVGAVNIH